MDCRNNEIALAYTRYADQIRSFIYARTGCFATAEDLTQEAFLRVHRKAGDLSAINNLRAYLFRIANNLVIDHYRAEGVRVAPHEPLDSIDERELTADQPSPEDTLARRASIGEAMRAVGELSALCQRIFWLSRAAGYRNHEIAASQGVCLSTVEKNISRASRRCLHLQQPH